MVLDGWANHFTTSSFLTLTTEITLKHDISTQIINRLFAKNCVQISHPEHYRAGSQPQAVVKVSVLID